LLSLSLSLSLQARQKALLLSRPYDERLADVNNQDPNVLAYFAYLREILRRYHQYVLNTPELLDVLIERRRALWVKANCEDKRTAALDKMRQRQELTEDEKTLIKDPLALAPNREWFVDDFKRNGSADVAKIFTDKETKIPQLNTDFVTLNGAVFNKMNQKRRDGLLKRKGARLHNEYIKEQFYSKTQEAPFGYELNDVGLVSMADRVTVDFHQRQDVLVNGSAAAVRTEVRLSFDKKERCVLQLVPKCFYLLRQGYGQQKEDEYAMPPLEFENAEPPQYAKPEPAPPQTAKPLESERKGNEGGGDDDGAVAAMEEYEEGERGGPHRGGGKPGYVPRFTPYGNAQRRGGKQ